MARKDESPQKVAMREMMRDYLKTNNQHSQKRNRYQLCHA